MLKKLSAQINFFLSNKYYFWTMILTAIAGYGYQLTHSTCGVDDICIDLYFEAGLGVAIGRWPFFVLNKIIPMTEYQPFIMDFFTLLLLLASAVMWCVIFRLVMGDKISMISYCFFTSIFLTYSMMADVFIFYLQNGIGLVFLLTALSLYLFYYLFTSQVSVKENILIKLITIVSLTFAISFYETAANIYLFGVVLICFLDLMYESKMGANHWKRFLGIMCYMVRMLLYSILARRVIRTGILYLFHIQPYAYRSASSVSWLYKNSFEASLGYLIRLLCQFLRDYFAVAVIYYPVFLFVLATIFFVGYVIYQTIKNRKVSLLVYGMLTYLSLYALSVVQCEILGYRACQTFSIFVGVTLLLATEALLKKNAWMKGIGITVIVILLINSAYDLNHWFALDYRKTEMEMKVIDQIAYDLKAGDYNIEEKPIVVVGNYEFDEDFIKNYAITEGEFGWELVEWAAEFTLGELNGVYRYSQMSPSIIDWSVDALASYSGYNAQIKKFFEYQGHTFLWADKEICEKVIYKYFPPTYTEIGEQINIETYEPNEAYPNEGYIVEMEDCIVIRL